MGRMQAMSSGRNIGMMSLAKLGEGGRWVIFPESPFSAHLSVAGEPDAGLGESGHAALPVRVASACAIAEDPAIMRMVRTSSTPA